MPVPKPQNAFNNKETKVDSLSIFEDNFRLEQSSLEDYEIIRDIGSGATGIVYEGVHNHLKRHVAIKVLKPHLCKNKVVLERFNREGETIARLKHENIATVFDYVSKGDMHYIVMEYIEGTTLEEMLREKRKLPVNDAVHIIMGVLRGLNIAHENGIVHRDIKPSNIIINEKGVPIIFDFGLAKLKDEAKNISNVPIGTPSYMAPEHFDEQKSNITPRTDFFSLGIMFYEMLTGDLPFHGNSFSTIMNRIINEIPLPPSKIAHEVPKKLDKIVMKLLEKEPKERYTCSKEILEDLDCYRKNLPLKHIKNWPLNTVKRFLYRYIFKNTFSLAIIALVLSFWLTYLFFTYRERIYERTIWRNEYHLKNASFLGKDWSFFESFHDGTPLSDVSKNQMLIPIDQESLIINANSALFGIYNRLSSSEVKFECDFREVIPLDARQPSRTGIFLCSRKDKLSGYIFYISGGRAYFSKNSIENTIMEKEIPKSIDLGRRINISMQKKGPDITVELNGVPVIIYQDFIPLASPDYGYSGILWDNMRMKLDRSDIFLLGMAIKTTPIAIGQKVMELGEYEKALAIFEDITKDIKDQETVLIAKYNIGIVETRLGRGQDALKTFDDVIAMSGNALLKSKGYYQKAMIYLNSGRTQNAQESFISAKNIYPSRASDLNILAGVFDYITNHPVESTDEASRHQEIMRFMFQIYPEFKPSFVHEMKNIAMFYFSQKEFEKSRSAFTFISEQFSFKKDFASWAQLMKGDAYLMEGRLDLAYVLFDKISTDYFDQKWICAWALYRKAYILSEQGQKEEAMKGMQEIIRKYRTETDDSYEMIVYRAFLEIQKLKNKF